MMSTDGEWTRSDTFQADLLHLFESSEYYDCSFKVIASQKPDGEEDKEFKCHKLVLAASSCVFAKMLMGKFKEAHLAADEPIPLHKVAPEVFESTMRFIYGQVTNFENVEFAMEVYEFAHEMQITSLMFAVNEFFKTVSPNDALAALDFCIQYENEHGLKNCKESLQGKNSSGALKCKAWLSATEAVVQEVLQMDQLDVSEKEVVEALMKWGRAQVEADGHDPAKDTKLRKKIGRSLKFIRWTQLDNGQIAELCQGDLGRVLDGEFSFQIVRSKLSAQLSPQPRTRQNFAMQLNLKKELAGVKFELHTRFCLRVSKRCCFVGLKFTPAKHSASHMKLMQPSSMELFEYGFSINALGKCSYRQVSGTLMLDAECILGDGIQYIIQLNFPANQAPSLQRPSYKVDNSVTSNDQLAISVTGPINGAKVTELIFRMID